MGSAFQFSPASREMVHYVPPSLKAARCMWVYAESDDLVCTAEPTWVFGSSGYAPRLYCEYHGQLIYNHDKVKRKAVRTPRPGSTRTIDACVELAKEYQYTMSEIAWLTGVTYERVVRYFAKSGIKPVSLPHRGRTKPWKYPRSLAIFDALSSGCTDEEIARRWDLSTSAASLYRARLRT